MQVPGAVGFCMDYKCATPSIDKEWSKVSLSDIDGYTYSSDIRFKIVVNEDGSTSIKVYDEASGSFVDAMLQVSSWGRKYYVSFEEYQIALSGFSNILVLEEQL